MSKFFTSPAIFTSKSLVSNFVIGPILDLPCFNDYQNVSTSFPDGEITPNPVMTTLRLFICILLFIQ